MTTAAASIGNGGVSRQAFDAAQPGRRDGLALPQPSALPVPDETCVARESWWHGLARRMGTQGPLGPIGWYQ